MFKLLQITHAADAANLPDDNKLMVVAAVMSIICLGIIVYLITLERRLKKIEQK